MRRLDVLFGDRERPTVLSDMESARRERSAREHGIHLIEVDGVWKWDFFEGMSRAQIDERVQILEEKTRLLKLLTGEIQERREGISETEMEKRFRGE